jgi:hypothetical protein
MPVLSISHRELVHQRGERVVKSQLNPAWYWRELDSIGTDMSPRFASAYMRHAMIPRTKPVT